MSVYLNFFMENENKFNIHRHLTSLSGWSQKILDTCRFKYFIFLSINLDTKIKKACSSLEDIFELPWIEPVEQPYQSYYYYYYYYYWRRRKM
jgi:hypothetical protein